MTELGGRVPESEVWCVEAPLAVLKIDSWHFPVNLWPSYRHECRHFVYGGTCLRHHEQGCLCVFRTRVKCVVFVFALYSCKANQTWLNSEELKFEAGKYCLCTNVDTTTIWSLQMEIFTVHALPGQLQSSFGVYFKPSESGFVFGGIVAEVADEIWMDLVKQTGKGWLFNFVTGLQPPVLLTHSLPIGCHMISLVKKKKSCRKSYDLFVLQLSVAFLHGATFSQFTFLVNLWDCLSKETTVTVQNLWLGMG